MKFSESTDLRKEKTFATSKNRLFKKFKKLLYNIRNTLKQTCKSDKYTPAAVKSVKYEQCPAVGELNS